MAEDPIEPVHEVKSIDDMVPAKPHRNRRSYFRQYLDSLLRLKHWQGWRRGNPSETVSAPPAGEEPPEPEEPPATKEPPSEDHAHINRQV